MRPPDRSHPQVYSARAGTRVRVLPALLGLLLLGACSSDSSGLETDVSMLVVAGDAQSAPVGTELASPVVAKLVDANGKPVKGQTVNFRVTSGGGSVFAGAATTNEAGIVQERWTLGLSTSEPQILEARTVDGESGEAITLGVFTAQGLPLAPTTIKTSSGGEGPAGGQATTVVRVVDVHGNGVPGETVRWAPSDTTVQAEALTSVTDARGEARMQWTLPEQAGSTVVLGHWNDQVAHVGVKTVAGEPAHLVPSVAGVLRALGVDGAPAPDPTDLLGGLPGAAPVLEHNLVVTDRHGNPVPNTVLTLKVVEGGGKIRASIGVDGQQQPEGTEATVRTNEYGQLYTKFSSRTAIDPYWRLGTGEGVNVFSVAISGGEEIRFRAIARSPFVHILWPEDGQTLTDNLVTVIGFACTPAGSSWGAPQVHAGDHTEAATVFQTFADMRCGYRSNTSIPVTSMPSGPITVSLSTTHTDGTVASASVTVTKP